MKCFLLLLDNSAQQIQAVSGLVVSALRVFCKMACSLQCSQVYVLRSAKKVSVCAIQSLL